MQVLLQHGLLSWTQANSGTIIQEEIKSERETETETEKGTVIATGSVSVPESESESGITVQLLACSIGELESQMESCSENPRDLLKLNVQLYILRGLGVGAPFLSYFVFENQSQLF